ncbi:MAG: GDSL-type esterase/lipase family protein [Panacagrimonas sp.]
MPTLGWAENRLPLLSPNASVLAFGDSLTDGVGGSGENYPQSLARRIGHKVVNAGIAGDTTAQGRVRLPEALQTYRPELLILCLGINDELQRVPRERIRENLTAMLRSAREAHVPVLLLALPRRGESSADPLFAEVAAEGGAIVDETSMVEVLSNPVLKADIVHANGEGYRQVAMSLAMKLKKQGALR